jgi:hypothetical protein
MSPQSKTTPILSVLIVMFFSLGCVTVTRAIEEIVDLDIEEQSSHDEDCDDCDTWDEFEYDANDRPILSGDEQVLTSEHFRIHYTLDGRDAIASEDYIREMSKAFEYSWQVEIDQFGWAPPPPDEGVGGDNRYDIYVQNIFADGTAGYTEGGDERYRGQGQGVIGDNPLTEAIETRSAVSYIVMDNDYAELDEWAWEDGEVNTLDPLDFMRSTAAHEFNHAIQFGYDGEEPADWLWEATASWMQDEVYDNINDAEEDLLAVFKSPDTCQLAYGGEERVEDENHWYGEWIFLRYISEHHGHASVRAIWEHARDLDGYAALEAALADAETTLDDTMRGFSLALLTRDFEEGAQYPILRLEGEATTESNFVPQDGVGQMAADYVEIFARGITSIELAADDLEGMLVGVHAGQAHVFNMTTSQITVDASPYDHLYLIVLNLDQARNENACEFAPYNITMQPSNQSTDLPIPDTYSVSHFSPPQIEPLLDPEEYWGEDWDEWDYEEVEAPSNLIPGALPQGYELIEAYQMEAADYEYEFDAELIWYIPGGGIATIIEFYGAGVEDFLDITLSESPYADLEEWFDDAEYEPFDDELYTIGGLSILVEDWSDEYGPYSIATFIADGQFIVVEGTLETDELIRIVESLPILK